MSGESSTTARWRRACREHPGVLGLPESLDPRILAAAVRLIAEDCVRNIRLYTSRQATLALAAEHDIALDACADKVSWAAGDQTLDAMARLVLAAEDLKSGVIDAALAGNQATTADVIRAGLRTVGLAPGVRTVSGAFVMHRPALDAASQLLGGMAGGQELTYLYADSGVVIEPTAAQLADIALESVKTWERLVPEKPPVVAFLSFSTKGSAKHASLDRVREALASLRALRPDVDADGELQFDAAFDAAIGQRKAPGSKVPGRANIFIFPDLNSGNLAYKITQRLGGFEAYGPFLQGLAKPYSDLSRGATVADIEYSALACLMRAQPAGQA